MRKAGPMREVPPPLEIVCLNTLWRIGEGNAGDVQRELAASKPLAYTTVLTLLERLAKKGVLSRRKSGRAYIYTPVIAREDMRRAAVRDFVALHFDGDATALAEHLNPAKTVAASASGIETSMDATLL